MKSPQTRMLLIDAAPIDAHWLQDILDAEPASDSFELEWDHDLKTGLSHLESMDFAAVLLDLNLPDSQGLETIHRIQAGNPTCPIVILAADSSNDAAAQAMQAGAQEYLVKYQVTGGDVIRAVRHAIDRKRFELDLGRRASELQALYETSLEINAHIDLPSLLQALVERAARLINVPMAGLYMIWPDGETLSLEYIYNLQLDFRGITLKMGEGLSGRVAQTGEPQAVVDYMNWEGRSHLFEEAKFRRILAVPLRTGGKVIGVINLIDDRAATGPWSPEEIRLASLFADQAAIAVNNTRLLEAERQKSAELARLNAMIAALSQVAGRLGETLDPDQILDTLGRELGKLGATVQLSLFEENPRRLAVKYVSVSSQVLHLAEIALGQRLIGFPIPEDFWPGSPDNNPNRSIFVKNPLDVMTRVFPGIPASTLEFGLARIGINSRTMLVYLPLVIKENVLGMMTIWGGDLREGDIQALSAFANQVAIALENARLYNRIERQAMIDDLTGLYNRRGFFMLAEQQLRVAQRTGSEVLLVFIDVDQLKLINDTCGHKEGDNALIETARALRATFRSADIPARISGDEFAVLAYPSHEVGAGPLLKRLRYEIAEINARARHPFNLSVSAGYAVWTPGKSRSLDDLLAQADAQMYQVKRKRTTGELKQG